MDLKKLMAGATIAGALGAAALGVGAGAASAAPGVGGAHGTPPAVSHGGPAPKSRAEATDRADRAAQVVQVAPDPAGPAATDPAVRADPATTVGGPGGLGNHGPGGPGGPGDHGPGGPGGPGFHGPGGPGGPGGPWHGDDQRGYFHGDPWETDPHLRVLARRRGRHGTGRFRRPVDRGTTARSITGATTKTRSGIRSSTSGASTSSESGFRCEDDPAVRS